jgi:hypothetical protein
MMVGSLDGYRSHLIEIEPPFIRRLVRHAKSP